MSGEQGAILWLVIDVGCVAAFAGALMYGLVRWRRARRSGSDQIGEAATDRMYHETERQAEREALQRRG